MQSSTYTLDSHTQADGRRYVRESFVDATGRTHESEYLAPVGWTATEYQAHLNTRSAQLDEMLAKREADRQITNDTWEPLVFQSAGEFADRFWQHVASVMNDNKIEYGRCLWWLENRLVAGDISDAGARNTFNTAFNKSLNAAQWTSLRTSRIQPAHSRYAALLGEGAL